ncbi:DUF7504 family protein [Halosimplex halophilum]|uniref:DUF7504 family protein n=1 Tax=Halosimplex halophilum TaxID=2559572 RepID=UPI00107EFBD9|nr:hypothetical protein [Halosimplex halophilum]
MAIRPGDNVLVCCPSFTGDEPRVCLDLLTPDGSTDVYALSVLFTKSPGEYVDTWQRLAGAYPTRMRIVTVDASAPSKGSQGGGADAPDDPGGEGDTDRAVERVNSPHNLTRLGVRVTGCLDEWDDAPETVAVCFQSLTTLLQYVDVDNAVGFLDAVTDRCAATDAVAHYHIDPKAHDEQTIAKLSAVFDTVLEFDDGEWTAR